MSRARALAGNVTAVDALSSAATALGALADVATRIAFSGPMLVRT
jgi:hypothetical protein